MDGVVSIRSFEPLLQWLYLGRVNFGELTPEEAVTATIEFVRLADMCGVTGMESLMAERIKTIIKTNPAAPSKKLPKTRDPNTNTHCLVSQHIKSAALLPKGHPVRGTLATAILQVPCFLECPLATTWYVQGMHFGHIRTRLLLQGSSTVS